VLQRIDGDVELLRELAATFLVNSEELVAEMRTAIDSGDFDTLRRAAHTYKGSASLFELTEIASRSQKLELLAKEQNVAEAAVLVCELQVHTTNARSLLHSMVEEIPCVS